MADAEAAGRPAGQPARDWALGRRNIVFRYQRPLGEIQPLCDELNQLVGSLR